MKRILAFLCLFALTSAQSWPPSSGGGGSSGANTTITADFTPAAPNSDAFMSVASVASVGIGSSIGYVNGSSHGRPFYFVGFVDYISGNTLSVQTVLDQTSATLYSSGSVVYQVGFTHGDYVSSTQNGNATAAITFLHGIGIGTPGADNKIELTIFNALGANALGADATTSCSTVTGAGIVLTNNSQNPFLTNDSSSLNVGLCGVLFATPGLTVDAGTTTAYPWKSTTNPSCAIAATGTTCNTTVALPIAGMVCTVGLYGTSPLVGGIALLPPADTISGTTETIYATAVGAVASGGTVTFTNVCN